MCVGGPVCVNSCALRSHPLLSTLHTALRDSSSTSISLTPPLLRAPSPSSACPRPTLLTCPLGSPTTTARPWPAPPRPRVTGPTPCLPRGPASNPPHAPCPHSPWGIGSLGLCLDGGPRAPQEGLGSGAHAIVVVAVERGAVARGREGAMAPRGGSTPRWAQVEDPAGARDGRLPVGVGGGTGWSRDVREAAAEKGGSSAPARTPGPHPPGRLQGSACPGQGCHLPGRGEAGGRAGRRSRALTGRRRPPC